MRATRAIMISCLIGAAVSPFAAADTPQNRPPVIKHDPIKIAVPGQSLFIRAVVADESGPLKSVALFYATSRDAAPFKLPMQAAGAGTYFVSIPESLLTGVTDMSYYIEAVDAIGTTSETPWYVIRFRGPGEPGPGASVAGQPPGTAAGGGKAGSWKKPALIAGGTLLLAGAGLAIANANSDGDGGSSDTGNPAAGTYVGSVTTCLEMNGSGPDCSAHAMSILVGGDGRVSSDTLRLGAHLEATLSGSEFTMTASATESNMTGQIRFSGSIFNGRVAGTIDGSLTGTNNVHGTYSGAFSATKQ